MGMVLDIRTMYFSMALAGLYASMALFFFSAGRYWREGMRYWTLGFAFQGVAWTLIGLRGIVPDVLTIVAANTLLVANYSLHYCGVRDFQGCPCRKSTLFLPATATAVLILFFWVFLDRIFYRAVYIAVVCFLQVVALAWALLCGGHSQERRSQWLTGGIFCVGAALWLHRLIHILLFSQDQVSILESTLVRNGSLGLGLGVVIIPCIGFLLMTRERDERMLRENEERFHQLADSTFEGIVIHDQGKILDVNQSILKMIGYGYDEVIGTDVMRYVAPASRELVLRSMQSGYDRPFEIVLTTKGGSTRTMEVNGKPLAYKGKQARMVALHDITERKKMEEAIRDISLRDPLTELYNRRGFITLGEQQLKAAHRAKRPMLLVFVDVDELKWINDKLGHDQGDRALIDTANILRLTFRESDIIARIGGDEFAVLAIDAADMNPELFSNRIGQDIHEFNRRESRPYRLAVSHGAALYDPESQLSLEQLISAADELMYVQKKAKGNR